MNADFYEKLKVTKNADNKNEAFPGMAEAEFAYHVVNVERVDREDQVRGALDNRFRKSHVSPEFEKLRWNLADDPFYDGLLLGLACVFFQTSVWIDEKTADQRKPERTRLQRAHGLPSKSPYPVLGRKGKKHWRVAVPLDYFGEHRAWYCSNPARSRKGIVQIRLILTKGAAEHIHFENCSNFIEVNLREPNPFLYSRDGKWFTNNLANGVTNYVTNFVVLKDFILKDNEGRDRPGIEWDWVERDERRGIGHPLERDRFADLLFQQWLSKLGERAEKKDETEKKIMQLF